MNVREKLVELLKKADKEAMSAVEMGKPYNETEVMGRMAENLIAHGVTVQEWISVTDRLPERDKEVLLIVHGWEDRLYYTGCLHRQEAERSWLTGIESKASDWKIWGFSYLREPIVTHWMPLPEPPKGE